MAIETNRLRGLFAYRLSLGGFIGFLALTLLTIVDFRRGFLFNLIPGANGYMAVPYGYGFFNYWQILMFTIGLIGMVISYQNLRKLERQLGLGELEGYVKILTFIFFALLVSDLFIYRGVPAARAAIAGKLTAGWWEAYGVSGWLRPIAFAISYLLTVWHATFLGILLAGLALTTLPRYLKSLFVRSGFRGSLFGGLFALPQPFCSCCAAVIAPSYVRQGASYNFSLAFVVGSPMINITTLILAALLLPFPFAVVRIVGGVVVTFLATYIVAYLAEKWGWWTVQLGAPQSGVSRLISRWVNSYCRLFHLEELVRGREIASPGAFLSAWFYASGRLALILVPTLFIWGSVAAAIIQLFPATISDNLLNVVIASVVGTLLMISTWTEIPVAASLIQMGLPALAATMLITLPPVSLPCLMLMGGSMGRFRPVMLLGLIIIGVGIVTGGLFVLLS